MQPEFPQAAYGAVMEQFYLPHFFEKLARDWGIAAASEEDARQLLETAALLRQQKENLGTGNDFLKSACDSLKELTANVDASVPTPQEQAIKEAAAARLNDPAIASAMEEWGGYLAQLV